MVGSARMRRACGSHGRRFTLGTKSWGYGILWPFCASTKTGCLTPRRFLPLDAEVNITDISVVAEGGTSTLSRPESSQRQHRSQIMSPRTQANRPGRWTSTSRAFLQSTRFWCRHSSREVGFAIRSPIAPSMKRSDGPTDADIPPPTAN